jgi:hypothetical protein
VIVAAAAAFSIGSRYYAGDLRRLSETKHSG